MSNRNAEEIVTFILRWCAQAFTFGVAPGSAQRAAMDHRKREWFIAALWQGALTVCARLCACTEGFALNPRLPKRVSLPRAIFLHVSTSLAAERSGCRPRTSAQCIPHEGDVSCVG